MTAHAFSPGENNAIFSLSAYQKARAQETSTYLDASRFHFQILFVDNDNFKGRIAEGMLANMAEYNDAMSVLFPSSATITSSWKAPTDSKAPNEAMAICESLGLCSVRCSEVGTAFDVSYLDEYDLIIALDDDIQSIILRSLPAESGYEQKCRSLSEFLSMDFCGSVFNPNNKNKKNPNHHPKNTNHQEQEEQLQEEDDEDRILISSLTGQESLQNMMESELWDKVQPFYSRLLLQDTFSSSDIFAATAPQTMDDVQKVPRVVFDDETGAIVPNPHGWPMVEAAMLVATAGLTRFCLDTKHQQFDIALDALLQQHFYRPEHTLYTLQQCDWQLCKSSYCITGYFSPQQRIERIKQHLDALKTKLELLP